MDNGVLVRFDVALDPKKALDLASYTLESWHYQRTYKYGSPHLKADGSPGQDWIAPSSVCHGNADIPAAPRVSMVRNGPDSIDMTE